jgi:hypothetical protein
LGLLPKIPHYAYANILKLKTQSALVPSSSNKRYSTCTKNAIARGMVVHVCNPCTQETEAGGSQVQDQPGLHTGILSPKKKQQKRKPGKKHQTSLCSLRTIFFFLRQGLPMQPWLASNLRSPCLGLLRTRIRSMCHHTQLHKSSSRLASAISK